MYSEYSMLARLQQLRIAYNTIISLSEINKNIWKLLKFSYKTQLILSDK